ncbi:MAG: cobalt ECF transporter T component CbiQ [Syntrophomonadaceae bacterium]|nr:cobalt ECF transporter T component CbiQ [Syntrophomonadaceae bacterium]
MLLPNWMNEPQLNDKIPVAFKTRNTNYLTKSIRNMRKVICEDLQTELLVRCDGLLQKVGPEMKLVGMIMLIAGISLIRQIPVLIAVWLITVLLMYLSRLPVLVLQKRIWGFIPLITLMFTMPMTLNVFIDGTPLLVLFQFEQPSHWLGINWPETIFISRQGVVAVTFLFLRVGMSLSLAALLVMTTPAADIFKSLRVLRVPDLFIMILEMTYRYLIVLLSISIEMFEARKVRTVGPLSLKTRQAQVGSSIAALFDRSMALSEEVYQAMCARCYTGSVPEPLLEE